MITWFTDVSWKTGGTIKTVFARSSRATWETVFAGKSRFTPVSLFTNDTEA